jgi:DNA anti-recombination protein RmuC
VWRELLEAFLGKTFEHFGLAGLVFVLVACVLLATLCLTVLRLVQLPRTQAQSISTALAQSLQGLPELLRTQHEDHKEISRTAQTIVESNHGVMVELHALSEAIFRSSHETQRELLTLARSALEQRDRVADGLEALLRQFGDKREGRADDPGPR